ncbi:hypothetical protein COLO4_16168 [Corchorus olitorius]|uniref:Uncharacterized protein n=1 Tax=Corchorus olitorius TaxID=93759 RepID=A0A1R3JIS7_9ROSI|nr:hypothetical protein COLO4_16168 [Corchorus olitorius]
MRVGVCIECVPRVCQEREERSASGKENGKSVRGRGLERGCVEFFLVCRVCEESVVVVREKEDESYEDESLCSELASNQPDKSKLAPI